MTKWLPWKTLALLIILSCFWGCGGDDVEDNNGSITDSHLFAYTSLEGHTDYVVSVAFNPDGQILASGSADNTIRLWDVIPN